MLSLSAGCQRSESEQPKQDVVEGFVLYGGEPVWEGRLTFLGADDRIATTMLGADGSFRVVNPPLGKVKVSVSNHPQGLASRNVQPAVKDIAGMAQCVATPRVSVVLPKRYAEPDVSGLFVDIRPGEQRIELAIPLQEGDPPAVKKPVQAFGPEVGNHAPEISGEDLEGQPLKLCDHRGKVVALVFWAHWCSLCRDQFPNYRAIAAEDREDFVVLGVNCDPDKAFLARQNAAQGINWRSWWDGASVGGPVTAAYQFQGFPSVILIDREGIIRHRNLRGNELKQAIDQMVLAAPANEPPRTESASTK